MDQFGLQKGKGTRDAIGFMRIISEREDICLCSLDSQKVFDCVDWTKLLEIL